MKSIAEVGVDKGRVPAVINKRGDRVYRQMQVGLPWRLRW